MATLVSNIGELVAGKPFSRHSFRRPKADDLNILNDAWLLFDNGKITGIGDGKQQPDLSSYRYEIDAKGGLVLPGLIDSHTHLLFDGNRSNEFADRLSGLTYTEIAERGGGIAATINPTRACSPERMANLVRERIAGIQRWGVTTLETKTGYGLTPKTEIAQLELLQNLRPEITVELVTTCLSLHSVPPEFSSARKYADAMSELLAEISERRLAEFVDAFIENGYFSVADCEDYMAKAKNLGLGIRIHADEFSDAGAAQASGRWQARSADHLQFASEFGIRAMGEAQTVATLLPGTSIYTKIPYTQASKFLDYCPVAVASDFNPGSCRIFNLPFLASLAAVHCGLSPAEAICGVTSVAALSVDREDRKGVLHPGFDADFLIHPAGDHRTWLADFGQTQPSKVFYRGEQVSY